MFDVRCNLVQASRAPLDVARISIAADNSRVTSILPKAKNYRWRNGVIFTDRFWPRGCSRGRRRRALAVESRRRCFALAVHRCDEPRSEPDVIFARRKSSACDRRSRPARFRAFIDERKTLVSGSNDRTLRFCDLATGRQLKMLPHDGSLPSLLLSIEVIDINSGNLRFRAFPAIPKAVPAFSHRSIE